MAWKHYYEHDCPETGEHQEMTLEKGRGPPVCLACGDEYEKIAD